MEKAIKEMKKGQVLEVTATDSQFTRDLPSWCEHNGHVLIEEYKKEKNNKGICSKELD